MHGIFIFIHLCRHVLILHVLTTGPGFVFNGRVLGELAVSRAIGDSDLKTRGKFLIATPEIVPTNIDLGTYLE
jgi:hypothetical protein